MIPQVTPTDRPRRYTRRHTSAMAWQVGYDNLREVAEWCGGATWAAAVVLKVDGYEQTAAIGDWIVKEGDRYSVIGRGDFGEHFVALPCVASVNLDDLHPDPLDLVTDEEIIAGVRGIRAARRAGA